MGNFTGAHAVRFSLVCPSFHVIQRVLNGQLPFSQARECSELVLTGNADPGFVFALVWGHRLVFLLRGPHLTVRFFQAAPIGTQPGLLEESAGVAVGNSSDALRVILLPGASEGIFIPRCGAVLSIPHVERSCWR